MDATSHFQSTEIKKNIYIYVPGRQLALSARLSGGPYKLDGILKIAKLSSVWARADKHGRVGSRPCSSVTPAGRRALLYARNQQHSDRDNLAAVTYDIAQYTKYQRSRSGQRRETCHIQGTKLFKPCFWAKSAECDGDCEHVQWLERKYQKLQRCSPARGTPDAGVDKVFHTCQ